MKSTINNSDYIQLHFNNAQVDFWNTSPNFYIHAWLFIKEILSALNSCEDNVLLVDNNIKDFDLREKVHRIRIRRNEFEHKNFDYVPPDKISFKNDCKTINEFIDYVNKIDNNKNEIEGKLLFSRIEKNQDKELFSTIETEKIEQNCNIKMKEESYLNYVGGYNAIPVEFELIISDALQNDYNSIFAVIHNLLLRSSKIKKSKYLKENLFGNEDLDVIFIYEIMILNSIRHGYFIENEQVFEVSARDQSLFILALNNIMFYYTLLGEMSNNIKKYNFRIVTNNKSYDTSRIEIVINNNKIYAEIKYSEYNNYDNCLWISTKINYELDVENYKFYKQMLNELFGFEDFKDGQISVIHQILKPETNGLMTILPTGYGKSLMYQFLSFIQPCISIVISPSNELIYDQLVNLEELSLDIAGYFELSQGLVNKYYRHKRLSIDQIQFNKLLYYITPKDILNEKSLTILSYLEKIRSVHMITIDECHHMSIWGHRFESEFFTVTNQLIDKFSTPKILMCSATASQKVIEDIRLQFENRSLLVIQPVPLDRGNIDYRVLKMKDVLSITNDIREMFRKNYNTNSTFDCSNISRIPTLTIIVNNSRSILLKVYSELSKDDYLRKYIALYAGENILYHKFRSGQKTIILCSEEYLYGINIPYLRNIIFIGLPPSKEWFYQQTGRVGRKGQESFVISYSFDESSQLFLDLIDQDKSTDQIFNNLRDLEIDYEDLSNATILTENLRDRDKEIRLIESLYEEIETKVYVSSTYEYGHLKGKIDNSEKDYYEFVLYIFFVSGMLKKWVVESDNDGEIRYVFGVNLDFEKNTNIFDKNAIDLINILSGNEEIRSFFMDSIISNRMGIVGILTVLVDWYLMNTIAIKRQMFINLWELAEDITDGTLTNTEIEKDLSFYFMGNLEMETNTRVDYVSMILKSTTRGSRFSGTNKNYNLKYGKKKEAKLKKEEVRERETKQKEVTIKTVRTREDSIKEMIADEIEFTKKTIQNNSKKDYVQKRNIKEIENIKKDSVNKYKKNVSNNTLVSTKNTPKIFVTNDTKYLNDTNKKEPKSYYTKASVRKSDAAIIDTITDNKEVKTIIKDKEQAITKIKFIDESLETNDTITTLPSNNLFYKKFSEFLTSNNIITQDVIVNIIEHLLDSDIDEKYWVKAMTERNLENKYNFNYEIILSIFELMNSNQKKYYRFKNIVNKLDQDTSGAILNKFSKKLNRNNKIIIDDILLLNKKQKYFYRGLSGFFKKLFNI